MTKLAKYLKSSAGLVVAIVALLFLQAYCDLTLPEYTSKIVNEGIQQKGIEDGVPDEMREETYDTLMTFLDEDGQSALEDSYEPDGDVYQLKSSIKGEKLSLIHIFDVGAKHEIYEIMNDLAAQGKAIIMISSEMAELLGMADRVYVMCDGKLRGEITEKEEMTQARVMGYATQF